MFTSKFEINLLVFVKFGIKFLNSRNFWILYLKMVLSFFDTVVIERFWIPLIYLKYCNFIDLKVFKLIFYKNLHVLKRRETTNTDEQTHRRKKIILGRRTYLLHREILNYEYCKWVTSHPVLYCADALVLWRFKKTPVKKCLLAQSKENRAWEGMPELVRAGPERRSLYVAGITGCLSRLLPNSFSPVELISEQLLLKCRWKAIEWSKWVRLTRTTI